MKIIISKTHRITVIIILIAIVIINKIIIKIFIKMKTIHYFNLIFLILLNYFYISSFYLFNNLDFFYIRVISLMLIISLFRIITEILYYLCSLQNSYFKLHLKTMKTEFISYLQNSSTTSIYNNFHKINFNLKHNRFIKIKKITDSLQIIMKMLTIKSTINLIILILFISLKTIKNKKLKISFS